MKIEKTYCDLCNKEIKEPCLGLVIFRTSIHQHPSKELIHLNIEDACNHCKSTVLDAVDVVVNDIKRKGHPDKIRTRLGDWEKYKECSARLWNVLRCYSHDITGDFYAMYIEDIDLNELRRTRNCGKITVNEFINLRGY